MLELLGVDGYAFFVENGDALTHFAGCLVSRARYLPKLVDLFGKNIVGCLAGIYLLYLRTCFSVSMA